MEDILVPFGFFATTVLIVWLAINARMKRMKMEHDERMLAIEKGVALPPAPEPHHRERQRNPYAWPLVLIGIGLAWMIAHLWEGEPPGWSLLPLLMGVGLLAARHIYKKHHPNGNGGPARPEMPVQ